ncbi:MAG TPA: DUF418 domain-containing protein [Terriglobales bacterium]|nr:DUF418 domain-containing protein [Terriglobales bacterium]
MADNNLAVVAGAMDEPVAQTAKALTPVNALERIQLIDILRGFALFGVLIANMKGYSLPMNAYFGFGADWPGLTPLDQGVDQFILWAIKVKFLSLFAVLFGLGLSVQLMRAQARGISVVPRYTRRLLVLLMFGTAHFILFWFGDILHTYALVGFILLLFRNLSVKVLGRILQGFFLAIILGTFVGSVVPVFRPHPAPSPKLKDWQKTQREAAKLQLDQKMQEEVRILGTGTFTEATQLRARQWLELYADWGTLGYFTFVLHLFLMGLYAGKRRIFQDVEANLPFLRKCMWFGLACLIAGLIRFVPPTPNIPVSQFVRNLLNAFSGYTFFFYAAGIALLTYRSATWRQKFSVIGPVGRMALTNYLTHTLLATSIFYGYGWGLGYFGKMGSTWGLVLSLAIYAAQIPFSAWWLKNFQFGPVEWLWRSLTYGKVQPMKALPEAQSRVGAIA